MESKIDLAKILPHLNEDLVSEIMLASTVKDVPKGTEILRIGQYVKVIPFVLKGLIKVFSSYEDKELLLYYIRPHESCVMSFTAHLKNEPSLVFALTEEDTTILLLPVDKVSHWIRRYPDINQLFFQQYNLRYNDLIDTINHLLFDKMDKRLYDYLQEKVTITKKNPLKISHRQIAGELGTAREVVSRVMKKLEVEGKVKQSGNYIELLPW
ncbi:MAG: Crp/Fnr family transcriptional regulator [Saprospiraceae bacterium]|nr:Crp/Fnr family transcriptional regulator [Saprospiraceae bacterium]